MKKPTTKRAPATHKKAAKREIKAEKAASAQVAIGKLKKGQDVFILTYGQFSLIDALMAILRQTGPADVIISTWTAASAHLDRAAEMMQDAAIRSLKMIVDRSFKTRQPAYYAKMIEIFGPNSIRETVTHAKFMTIRNDHWDVVVRTSMNLNENPRLENIEISEDRGFADFFQKIADEIFLEIGPGESPNTLPKLSGVKNSSHFREIDSAHISISQLKEPRYETVINTKSC